MEDSELFLDILLVAVAALLGGALAQALRLPTIIGFLAAGVAIGPSTPGPVGSIDDIARAADIGVIFLMFGIGIQLSFRQVAQYRRLIMLGGSVQVVSTALVGIAIGRLIGLDWAESTIVGFVAANTSTVVASKVLEGRQELKSIHGIATINISILQDLSAVLMVIVVPSLAGDRLDTLDFLFAATKGLALIAITYVMSVYLLPWVWRRIAFARSRELSLLAAVTLAVGLATGSGLLGLSIAFGAFLAGLAISENEYGHSTLADIIPLREVFASIFFVSMGMLIEPEVAWEESGTVIALVVLIIGGKGLLSMFAVRLVGLSVASALLAGLLLAQIGEFSFVIARTALDEGVIEEDLASAFLVAAVLSMVLNPGLVRLGALVIQHARHVPGIRSLILEAADVQQAGEIESLSRHVIVCGYGDSSATLMRSLRGRNLPYVVIDNNPFVFERVRRIEPDLLFIYGDASRPEVLDIARVAHARALAITFPNEIEAQITAFNARSINPRLDIVTRGTRSGHSMLRRAGSSEVVDPEFEAGLEFVRHVLHRFGIDAREITALQAQRRAEHYRAE